MGTRKHGARRGSKAGPLPELRHEIDRVDGEVLRLLSERRKLIASVIRAKDQSGAPLRDSKREEELLGRVIARGRRHGLDAHFVSRVFHEVIDDSLRVQQSLLQRLANPAPGEPTVLRVAFQGIEGAYSHLAAKRYLAVRPEMPAFVGLPSFAAVVRAVEEGQADLGILPIENTTSGAINEVYDILLHTRLAIVGEVKFKVDHCLAAPKRVSLASLTTIYAHPQAAAQCSAFLAKLPSARVQYYNDTAESTLRVREDDDTSQGAIASPEAARLYELVILKRGIANQKENFTRFLIAARRPLAVDLRIPCKTSLVMATGQQAGALVEALLVFRTHEINLTKLESRPIPGNPWEEMFYVDFEGNLADQRIQTALDELARLTRYLKVLGSYPSEDLPPTVPPPTAGTAPGAKRRARRGGHAKVAVLSETPPSKSGYRLASRSYKPDDTVIEVKGVRIGGDSFVVIAGPCAVETPEQVMACARAVREYGGMILRGGCFKPRSSPYSFQGLGWEGLVLLGEAGRSYGLPVITEVLQPADVDGVAREADLLQIGARNMQNFPLLREVGRVMRPVMLKRGLMSSLDELLQAAEYILAQGNHQVILCERGIRTFETATRNTLDLSAIPILKGRTHLPVLVDPSHAAGERALVPPLARAARAVGAHGIMVEIHPEPEKALSDGPQSLTFPQFAELMGELLG